jgi:hypothetical protein
MRDGLIGGREAEAKGFPPPENGQGRAALAENCATTEIKGTSVREAVRRGVSPCPTASTAAAL